MLQFLTEGVLPTDMSTDQRKKFALKSRPFLIIAGALYRRGADQIIRRCVPEEEQKAVLQEAHFGVVGGHFSGEITGRKIMQSGLWWPLLIRDAHTFAKECVQCQKLGQPTNKDRCKIIRCYHWNHFKSGAWISSGQLSQDRRVEQDTYWWQPIMQQNGWKQ